MSALKLGKFDGLILCGGIGGIVCGVTLQVLFGGVLVGFLHEVADDTDDDGDDANWNAEDDAEPHEHETYDSRASYGSSSSNRFSNIVPNRLTIFVTYGSFVNVGRGVVFGVVVFPVGGVVGGAVFSPVLVLPDEVVEVGGV